MRRAVQRGDALDLEPAGADAVDTSAHGDEALGDVGHLGLHGGVLDHGAQRGLADRLRGDGHAVVPVGDVDAHEDDAGVGFGRPHRDLGERPGVDTHAREQRRRLDGVLEGAALETVCHAGDLPWNFGARVTGEPCMCS